MPLYARVGIPEAWLVNLSEDRIDVYRHPMATGYQALQRLERGMRLSPLAFADLVCTVDDILGFPLPLGEG